MSTILGSGMQESGYLAIFSSHWKSNSDISKTINLTQLAYWPIISNSYLATEYFADSSWIAMQKPLLSTFPRNGKTKSIFTKILFSKTWTLVWDVRHCSSAGWAPPGPPPDLVPENKYLLLEKIWQIGATLHHHQNSFWCFLTIKPFWSWHHLMWHPDVLWPILHGQLGGAPHALAVGRADIVADVVVVVVVVVDVQAVGGGLTAVLLPSPPPALPGQARQIKLQTRPTEIKNKLSPPEKSEEETKNMNEWLKSILQVSLLYFVKRF